MTAHKHAEMIKAKADNMGLVVFSKHQVTGEWGKVNDQKCTDFGEQIEYFICLAKHKDVCLHWLNGGETEYFDTGEWSDAITKDDFGKWKSEHFFMHEYEQARIKTRKEKRWIGIYHGEFVTEKTMSTLQDAREYVSSNPHYKYCAPEGWQFIEIEVEV